MATDTQNGIHAGSALHKAQMSLSLMCAQLSAELMVMTSNYIAKTSETSELVMMQTVMQQAKIAIATINEVTRAGRIA